MKGWKGANRRGEGGRVAVDYQGEDMGGDEEDDDGGEEKVEDPRPGDRVLLARHLGAVL